MRTKVYTVEEIECDIPGCESVVIVKRDRDTNAPLDGMQDKLGWTMIFLDGSARGFQACAWHRSAPLGRIIDAWERGQK